MILAVDMGNTNIVVGGIDENQTYFLERVKTDPHKTAIEYAIILKNLLAFSGIDPMDLDGAILSSVVPQANKAMLEAIRKVTAFDAILVRNNMKTNLTIDIYNPAELGSDILVTSVAGVAEYKLPLAVIDMGTATKIFVVDESKTIIGGVILPGIKTSLEALSTKTSLLPHVDIRNELTAIGKDSAESMRGGVIIGHAGMIDGIVDKMEEQLGVKLNLIATGGLASQVSGYCKHSMSTDNDLLLKGLYILYKLNHFPIERVNI